ncbi:MAG: rhodanese-like domain-containing protein [Bacteroidales bacterium]|nr:rhodanese-like domain-containing protein [Bacteroidales bacterium]
MSMYLLAILLIVATSCKKKDEEPDPTPTVDYYKTMTDYMAANSMDLSDVISSWTISAYDLDSLGIANYYIIDLRSSTDFAAGHIDGAHNTTLANILTEAGNAAGKPIVVACYTGQTAAHGVTALRLSGYSDSKILLFGMSSWNAVFDSWTANTGDAAVGHSNWSTTNTIQANVTYSLPSFTSTNTTGAAILAERVQAMLDGGFQGVTVADVLASPSNYFINNYWTDADVNTYGHIVGAHRIKEDLTLAIGGFKYYDKDATVVTYCWTGQTASAITAYLNILGYNAKSLKFSANAMIYSQLQAHKWSASGNYPYVTN